MTTLGNQFNDYSNDSDSSEPPPGRPGDTEDFFVPYYKISDESQNKKSKARISTFGLSQPAIKTTSLYEQKEDELKSQHNTQNSQQTASTIPTPVPSSNSQQNANSNSNTKNKPQQPNNGNNNNNNNNHNNKQMSLTKQIQPPQPQQQTKVNDFSRATKWDIVYLTSSPLVFGSDPYKPLDQLDISGERDSFFNTLKQSKQKLRVIHKTATTSNIIAAVTGGCRCIHYSGHGYPSYLAFEDAKRIGETHLVHYDLIRKVCEDEDQRIEFVFASACHSEHVGEAFIEAGIQHVVAVNTKFEVTDEAASVFTKHFYNTLLNGRTIEKAFKIARHAVAAMASSARLDHDKFLLLPRDGNHNVNIFGNLEPGNLIDDTLATPVNNLPPAVPSFVGRAIDQRHIIHQLMDSGVRLLVLTGNSGIGKSATALMVARYFCDRRMFRGGIFFIDVKKLNNECNSLSAMLLRVFEECKIPIPEPNKSSHHDKELNVEDEEKKNKEDVFNIIRTMGEMLLVFDGLDQFGEGNNNHNLNESEIQDSIQSFLQNIFEKCSIDTKVLVTSSKKLHMFADFTNCISRYYMIRKLKPKDAAKLFSRLCNQFRHTDVVSNHELMRILEYNPKQITRTVQIKHRYHCDTLEGIVKAYNTKVHLQHQQEYQNQQKQKLEKEQLEKQKEEQKLKEEAKNEQQQKQYFNQMNINANNKKKQILMEKYIKLPSARVLWSESNGIESIEYAEMFEILRREFIEQTNCTRTLKANHLIPAFEKFANMSSNRLVLMQHFNGIYEWFLGIIDLIRVLFEEWNEMNPCAIAGFVTREMAVNQLQNMQSGAFIIRFSNTWIKHIAISYKDTRNVKHIRARLLSPQSHKFAFYLTNQTSLEMPLASFIQKFKKLCHLYDWHNNALQPKVDVYFGKGKAASVSSPRKHHHSQSPHQQYGMHQHQDSSHSLYRSQSMYSHGQQHQYAHQQNGVLKPSMSMQQMSLQQVNSNGFFPPNGNYGMQPLHQQQQLNQQYQTHSYNPQQINHSHTAYM